MNYKEGDIVIAVDNYYKLAEIQWIGRVVKVHSTWAAMKTIYRTDNKHLGELWATDKHFMKLNEAIQRGLGYEI